MVTRINESKAETKYISCDYKCKFNGRKCNLNKKWNKKLCQWECWNPSTCACEINRYLKSITDECDEIICVVAKSYSYPKSYINFHFNEKDFLPNRKILSFICF